MSSVVCAPPRRRPVCCRMKPRGCQGAIRSITRDCLAVGVSIPVHAVELDVKEHISGCPHKFMLGHAALGLAAKCSHGKIQLRCRQRAAYMHPIELELDTLGLPTRLLEHGHEATHG